MSKEELNYLREQLKGLEAILLELTPFRVPLKRQDIQDFYDGYFNLAKQTNSNRSLGDLRRQFNLKANQVQHIVDRAESMGNAQDRLNLIYAACSLPSERKMPLRREIEWFCRLLITESKIDDGLLEAICTAPKISASEARLLLGSTMFLITEYLERQSGSVPLYRLLEHLIELFEKRDFLRREDPFMFEASCLVEAMRN